jgi:hypothetical protein
MNQDRVILGTSGGGGPISYQPQVPYQSQVPYRPQVAFQPDGGPTYQAVEQTLRGGQGYQPPSAPVQMGYQAPATTGYQAPATTGYQAPPVQMTYQPQPNIQAGGDGVYMNGRWEKIKRGAADTYESVKTKTKELVDDAKDTIKQNTIIICVVFSLLFIIILGMVIYLMVKYSQWDSRITAAESAISAFKVQLGTLSTSVAANTTAVSTVTSAISGVKSSITTATNELSTQGTKISSIQTALTGLQTAIAKIPTDYIPANTQIFPNLTLTAKQLDGSYSVMNTSTNLISVSPNDTISNNFTVGTNGVPSVPPGSVISFQVLMYNSMPSSSTSPSSILIQTIPFCSTAISNRTISIPAGIKYISYKIVPPKDVVLSLLPTTSPVASSNYIIQTTQSTLS